LLNQTRARIGKSDRMPPRHQKGRPWRADVTALLHRAPSGACFRRAGSPRPKDCEISGIRRRWEYFGGGGLCRRTARAVPPRDAACGGFRPTRAARAVVSRARRRSIKNTTLTGGCNGASAPRAEWRVLPQGGFTPPEGLWNFQASAGDGNTSAAAASATGPRAQCRLVTPPAAAFAPRALRAPWSLAPAAVP